MTNERVCANSPGVSRRTLLTAAAGASIAGPVAAFSPSGGYAPVDPLPAWFEEWYRKRATFDAHPTGDGPVADALFQEMMALEELIYNASPKTAKGAAAQLTWVLEDAKGTFEFSGQSEALNACRDALVKGGVA